MHQKPVEEDSQVKLKALTKHLATTGRRFHLKIHRLIQW